MKQNKTEHEIEAEVTIIFAAQKDLKQFRVLYDNYFEKIFRFIYQRIDSKVDASDITSIVFLKAMENIKKFNPRGVPFSAWLIRIAINELNNFYNKSKKERIVNIDNNQIECLFDETEIDSNEDTIKKIIQALSLIKKDDLIFLELRFFEQHSFKEISEILQITENNAKVKTYRVIEKLKSLIAKL